MAALIVAQTFFERHDNQLAAVLIVAVTFAAVVLVNRVLTRAHALAVAVRPGHELSREADTRLRFLRRSIDAVVVLIGLALALSEFTALDKLGRTVLASSAIAAAVIGFAARQVLANAVAGLQLAITQPLRVGDVITFDGQLGVVEDVRLTSTWLRTASDARIVVPNELLAAGILRNDTIASSTVAVEAEVWIAADLDPIVALDAVRRDVDATTVRIAETTADGVRLLVVGAPAPPADRPRREAELREAALRAIHGPGGNPDADVEEGAEDPDDPARRAPEGR